MTSSRASILTALSAAFAILVFTVPAHACSCVPPGSPTESLAASDAVFVGEVIESNVLGSFDEDLHLTLAVRRSWKGVTTAEVELHTPAFDSLCGVTGLEKGAVFLVYARATPAGKLTTDLCTRTRPLAQAEDDLVELGPTTLVPVEPSTFGAIKGHFDP